jgi:hypothetical protein
VVPPVDVGPVLLLLPQAETQAAAPNTKTRDPILFFNISSLNFECRVADHCFRLKLL